MGWSQEASPDKVNLDQTKGWDLAEAPRVV